MILGLSCTQPRMTISIVWLLSLGRAEDFGLDFFDSFCVGFDGVISDDHFLVLFF